MKSTVDESLKEKEIIMEISKFAGKPADLSQLINVPRLVTAYYTGQPDPSVRALRVVFKNKALRKER